MAFAHEVDIPQVVFVLYKSLRPCCYGTKSMEKAVFCKTLRIAIGLFALLYVSVSTSTAEEVITSYNVDIIIQESGALQITEQITVIAENNKIKRGIYRDFPTTYRDRYGNRVRVAFAVQKVLVDGVPENYFHKTMSNGIRTYIGKKDQFVSRGIHEYTITYTTDRQIGFFENHDELYFNAIPHGFDFPILRGKIAVYLPQSLPDDTVKLSGYSGSQGARGQDFTAWKTGSAAYFELTKSLAAREGLTIVIEFPKGVITEPTSADRILWFVKDNIGVLVGILGFIFSLCYFLVIWDRVGRDPMQGTIIPRWEAPEGFSAADMRYVMKRSCDSTVIAACVVEAAIKGWVEIIERKKSKTLKKTYGNEQLSKEAQTFVYELFSGKNQVELNNKNHSTIRRAIDKTRNTLEAEHRKRSFFLNRNYLYLGAAISIISALLMIVLTALSTGFPFTFAVVVLTLLLLALPLLFRRALEKPTREGRRDLDYIEGFKMYLATAERDTFRKIGAPDDTLEIYEKFLPFAVALGVDYEWGKRFKSIIEQAIAAGNIDEHRADLYRDTYQNNWFKSNGISAGLSSAIASSSTPPGSRSGGGGGGFSGGGGGGGGGGGW